MSKTLIDIGLEAQAKHREKWEAQQRVKAAKNLAAATQFFNNFFKLYEYYKPISSSELTYQGLDYKKYEGYFISKDDFKFFIKVLNSTDLSKRQFALQVEVPNPGGGPAWVYVHSLLDFVPTLRVYGLIDDVHKS